MHKLFLLFALFLVFSVDVFAQGCSQCKLLAEQSSGLDENAFGSNINFGILYLMLFPYVILMVIFRKQILRFFRGMANKSNTSH